MRKPAIYVFLVLAAFATSGDYYISTSAAARADQPKPELVTQTGHLSSVDSIAISPDKKWIATAGFNDTSVKIWSAETGRELRAFLGHKETVKSVVVSRDGKFVVSGAGDGMVKIWDVVTGVDVSKFGPIEGTVEAVAISDDGTRIAAGGSGKTIFVREVSTGADIARLSAHGSISALAFSPDGQTLASGSVDQSVRVWNIAKGTSGPPMLGHKQKIRVLRFNPTGEVLASGGPDKSVRVWKVVDSSNIGVDPAHSSGVEALYFSDASKLVSVDADRTTKTWDISLPTAPAPGTAPIGDRVNSASSAAFSLDGSWIATGEGGGNSMIFETATGRAVSRLANYTFGFNAVAFSPDGHWMAAGSRDKSVKLWDLETGESLPAKEGHGGYVTAVVFQPGKPSRRMISASTDGTIKVWDPLLSKPIDTLPGHIDPQRPTRTFQIGALAVGGKGKLLASGATDKRIALWNLDAPKSPPRYLAEHKAEVTSVAISADERLVASASADGTVRVWDVELGTSVRMNEAPAEAFFSIALSPDGKLVAAGGKDNKILIWEVESRRLLHTIPGHTAEVLSVQFSPDGVHLASTSADKTARTWSVGTGQAVRTFNEHAGRVPSAAFSPDGRLLTTASHDGTLITWKADTGERGASLISLRNGQDWLVVTPQGFFDGAPTSYGQLSWRFEGDTFKVVPVEVFFNEFYKPGLLSDLFANRKLPNSNISAKRRELPELLLTKLDSGPGANPREVAVRIDVTDAPAGARDVRLFRNGTLVEIWRGDQKKGAVLETRVPLVAGKNRLTAYAFNVDDVKSIDQSLDVTGPPDLKKGIAYVLAIGVDSYANKEFDLAVAVKDAKTFAEEFKSQQERLGNAEKVDTTIVPNDQATKKNILDKLSQFAAKVKPEDSLTIFYAGHGLAVDDRFYLIPHDIGYAGYRPIPPDEFKNLVGNWISDEDIGKSVEKIDAGQLLMVIDACNSGKALDVTENRRGPMNSKGLAQLAYEKGMYILTAAQGFQDAKEDVQLGHGYLTHALVVEGLRNRVADRDNDKEIYMREWLDFATERVPEIDREEIVKGAKEKRRKLEEARLRGLGRERATGDKILALQRPRVFYRRESEANRIVVARY